MTSKIVSVTVFLQGAEVTRMQRLSVNPGKNRVCFSDLPEDLYPPNIRVKLIGSAQLLTVSNRLEWQQFPIPKKII